MKEIQEQTLQVLVCEDSQEGILTGIYEAFARGYMQGYQKGNPRQQVRLTTDREQELCLFSEYHNIPAEEVKACKVAETVRKLGGGEVFYRLCLAMDSCEEGKAQAVFKAVLLMLQDKAHAARVLDRLQDQDMQRLFTIWRNVQNEVCRWKEFIRFQELDNGMLYALFSPKNDVVVYIMPHFADRFPRENFVIYDEGRKLLGVHPAGKDWYLVRDFKPEPGELCFSEKEEIYRDLFRCFFQTIAIQERKNPGLQRNLMPLWTRKNMPELQPKGQDLSEKQ